MVAKPQKYRPALRYFGGKWRLAPWIISHFPRHSFYIEPYGGSMSVLLQKPQIPCEVYNDLNDEVVTYFKVLRERPADLIRSLELTPYARTELARAYARTDEDIETARRVFVRSYQSFGAHVTAYRNSGWRRRFHSERPLSPTLNDFKRIDHLYAIAKRIRDVHIECAPALDIIRDYDHEDALFYIDPPYVHETRTGHHDYFAEMTDLDHAELAELLHSIKAQVVISGYESDLYLDLYKDWAVKKRTAATISAAKRTECLWISPTNRIPAHQPRLV